MISVLYSTNTLGWILSMLTHYSQQEDMSQHSRHIILTINYSVFTLTLGQEAANTNFIVFSFTQPGIKPTMYDTQQECTNHYISKTVSYDYS